MSEEGTWDLSYPRTDENMPTMPLERPTALLALAQPQPLKSISLSGAGLISARAWVSTYDQVEHYDTEEWRELGASNGSDLNWVLPDELAQRDASIILLQADVKGDDLHLILKLTSRHPPSLTPKGEQ